jgi:hypothetical protein
MPRPSAPPPIRPSTPPNYAQPEPDTQEHKKKTIPSTDMIKLRVICLFWLKSWAPEMLNSSQSKESSLFFFLFELKMKLHQ